MPRGGKREGAGRKKGEESKRMYVPVSLLEGFEKVIELHKKGVEVTFYVEEDEKEEQQLDAFNDHVKRFFLKFPEMRDHPKKDYAFNILDSLEGAGGLPRIHRRAIKKAVDSAL